MRYNWQIYSLVDFALSSSSHISHSTSAVERFQMSLRIFVRVVKQNWNLFIDIRIQNSTGSLLFARRKTKTERGKVTLIMINEVNLKEKLRKVNWITFVRIYCCCNKVRKMKFSRNQTSKFILIPSVTSSSPSREFFSHIKF